MKRLVVVVALLAFFAWRVYSEVQNDKQAKLEAANKMVNISAEHDRRESTIATPTDNRLWLPEVREEYHTFLDYQRAELKRYEQALNDVNNGKMMLVNQTDLDAGERVYDDLSQLLTTLDTAVWVPGVKGNPVVQGEETRSKVLSELKQFKEDEAAFNAAEAEVEKAYNQQQKEYRGN